MSWKSALTKNLQELRIHLCQTSQGSQGVRDFIFNSYPALKKANPEFPILIREASGVKARLIARYDFGKETSVIVEGLPEGEVSKELEALVKQGSK